MLQTGNAILFPAGSYDSGLLVSCSSKGRFFSGYRRLWLFICAAFTVSYVERVSGVIDGNTGHVKGTIKHY